MFVSKTIYGERCLPVSLFLPVSSKATRLRDLGVFRYPSENIDGMIRSKPSSSHDRGTSLHDFIASTLRD